MNSTIGNMNWYACRSCKHTDELLGGCNLNVPDSLDMMNLNYDYIECNKYEKYDKELPVIVLDEQGLKAYIHEGVRRSIDA